MSPTLVPESTLNKVFRYDTATYHKLSSIGLLPRNTELIHGVIFNKMTISPRHRKVVNKLRDILTSAVKERFIILQESPITIGDSEPEPDISALEGTYDDFGDRHPETAAFVVEVAYSSLEDDIYKANIYASANIAKYWILDLQNQKIEVFENPVDGKYTSRKAFGLEEKIQIPLTNKMISLSEIL